MYVVSIVLTVKSWYRFNPIASGAANESPHPKVKLQSLIAIQ